MQRHSHTSIGGIVSQTQTQTQAQTSSLQQVVDAVQEVRRTITQLPSGNPNTPTAALAAGLSTGLLIGAQSIFAGRHWDNTLISSFLHDLLQVMPACFNECREHPELSFSAVLQRRLSADSTRNDLLQHFFASPEGLRLLSICNQAVRENWSEQRLVEAFVRANYQGIDTRQMGNTFSAGLAYLAGDRRSETRQTLTESYARFMGTSQQNIYGENFARVMLATFQSRETSESLRTYIEQQSLAAGIAQSASFSGIASTWSGRLLSTAVITAIARGPGSLTLRLGSAILCGAASSLGQIAFQALWATRNMPLAQRLGTLAGMSWDFQSGTVIGMCCGALEFAGTALLGSSPHLLLKTAGTAANFALFNVGGEMLSTELLRRVGLAAGYVQDSADDLLGPHTLLGAWCVNAEQEIFGDHLPSPVLALHLASTVATGLVLTGAKIPSLSFSQNSRSSSKVSLRLATSVSGAALCIAPNLAEAATNIHTQGTTGLLALAATSLSAIAAVMVITDAQKKDTLANLALELWGEDPYTAWNALIALPDHYFSTDQSLIIAQIRDKKRNLSRGGWQNNEGTCVDPYVSMTYESMDQAAKFTGTLLEKLTDIQKLAFAEKMMRWLGVNVEKFLTDRTHGNVVKILRKTLASLKPESLAKDHPLLQKFKVRLTAQNPLVREHAVQISPSIITLLAQGEHYEWSQLVVQRLFDPVFPTDGPVNRAAVTAVKEIFLLLEEDAQLALAKDLEKQARANMQTDSWNITNSRACFLLSLADMLAAFKTPEERMRCANFVVDTLCNDLNDSHSRISLLEKALKIMLPSIESDGDKMGLLRKIQTYIAKEHTGNIGDFVLIVLPTLATEEERLEAFACLDVDTPSNASMAASITALHSYFTEESSRNIFARRLLKISLAGEHSGDAALKAILKTLSPKARKVLQKTTWRDLCASFPKSGVLKESKKADAIIPILFSDLTPQESLDFYNDFLRDTWGQDPNHYYARIFIFRSISQDFPVEVSQELISAAGATQELYPEIASSLYYEALKIVLRHEQSPQTLLEEIAALLRTSSVNSQITAEAVFKQMAQHSRECLRDYADHLIARISEGLGRSTAEAKKSALRVIGILGGIQREK